MAGRENIWLEVMRHDREPNIFPPGPTTQSISILSYYPAALSFLCFLIVFFFFGDERLCFARIFKEPMITVRHLCEKPVKFYLNDADFEVVRSVRSGLILF